MEGLDYSNQLSLIITKLTEAIQLLTDTKNIETLMFLVLSIFLVMFVLRGE